MLRRCRRLSCFAALLALAVCAQAQGVAEKQVEVFGQKIHYLEGGAGPTVILLHGLGVDSSSWAATAPALAKSFHVFAPDQIGFGQSDKPLMPYRVATFVDFLDGFYKQTGVTKATLVGNSLGGWIAAAFALKYPEKVERVVLVDAAGLSPGRWGGPKLTREAAMQLNPATREDMRKILQAVIYNQQMITDQAVEAAFAGKLKRNDGFTTTQVIESIVRGEDLLDGRLGALRAPTLVVWGREDALTPLAIGKALHEDIKGSELLVLDRCGHAPQLECAGAFNAALLKFISTPANTGAASPGR
jgi:2-hydroxy-6-oxonona-2,4-dienedioate hydrolase